MASLLDSGKVVVIKLARLVLSLAAAALLCIIGYGAFIASIHNPGPFFTFVQWVTLPVFSIVAACDSQHSDLSYWVAIAVGWSLWSAALYAILSLVPHVHQGELT